MPNLTQPGYGLEKNKNYLPLRHQDPPASPKAKPMADRHKGYFFYIFLGGENKRFCNKRG
jgi:hypothetical protein